MSRKRHLLAALSLCVLLTLLPARTAAAETMAGPLRLIDGGGVSDNGGSTGSKHNAVIDANGDLWMWGSNNYGQLGDGTTTDRSEPVKILDNVSGVDLGYYYSAAIRTDGSLWTWGRNSYGELGDGTTTSRSEPAKILDNVSCVSLGSFHSAAIKADGSLWMWGWNDTGQLGDGTTAYQRSVPVKIMDDVSAVSVGGGHTAVIKTDGSLWTWGWNRSGRVGNGTTTDQRAPVKIMDDVSSVNLGGTHSAAIKADGSLWTWGSNSYGQLGDGTTTDRSAPVKILDDVSGVSLGGYHSAAIRTDGSLWMWGGENSVYSRTPVKIEDKVRQVNAGGSAGLFVADDESLWQYAVDGIPPSKTQIELDVASVPHGISLDNESLTLSVKASATLTATIYPADNQDSALTWTSSNPDAATVENGLVTAKAAGEADITVTAAKTGDSAVCHVTVSAPQERTMDPFQQIVSGGCDYDSTSSAYHAVIDVNGSLWMWGTNSHSELGDGTTTARSEPVKILDNVAAVSLGGYHSAAIKTDGSLWTWGWNMYGQLGNGTTTNCSKPVKILDNVAAVCAGGYHSAAIKTDGSLWTWGRNERGQLGDGTTTARSEPVKILDNVAGVSLGGSHSAALKTDGSLWTWGWNDSGRLGDGTTTNHSEPVKIMDGVSSVNLGAGYSAALKTDGSLWTWGWNMYGQLGDGTTTNRSKPVKIMDGVSSVNSGGVHSVALKTDGSAWMWGGIVGACYSMTPVKIKDKVLSVSAGHKIGLFVSDDYSLWQYTVNGIPPSETRIELDVGDVPHGISLDSESLTLPVNASATLTATIYPADNRDSALDWTSSNPDAATVENGLVTARAAGEADITVTAAKTGDSAACHISVPAPLTLDKDAVTLRVGDACRLTPTLNRAPGEDDGITWISDAPDVASVSDDGMVSALAGGTATVSAVTPDGAYRADCVVTVPYEITGVRLDRSSLTMRPGDSVTLTATVTPEEAEEKNVLWLSSSPGVATAEGGVVKAWSVGQTTVTAVTASGGFTASCTVTVNPAEIEDIEITPPDRTSFTEGSPLDITGLSVRVVYKDGSKADVTDYTLSGYEATVGSHTITVSFSFDGSSYTTSFDVRVVPKEVTLTGLSVTRRPTKTAYAKGEALDLSGMEVTAQYSDESQKVVTEDYTVTGYNANLTGAQIITVSYGGVSAQFSVTVGEAEIVVLPPRMRITGYPGGKEVALSHEEEDAAIYYTTNGDAPTAASVRYDNTPIRLTERTVLKAVAVKDGRNSSVASGLISVPKTPLPTFSHDSGETLLPGTIVTLKSSESNVTFYYTTDGSEPALQSTKYGGSILVDRSMTIRAVAVKDGCQVSDSVEATYYVRAREPQPNKATVAVGHVESRAGEHISNSVSIFTEGESNVTSFRFTIQYDKHAFEFVSLSPVEGQSSSSLSNSADRENGTVTVICNNVSMPSGEVCVLNFDAFESDEDGTYELSVLRENIAITTDADAPLTISLESGSIVLEGSPNSQLTGEILYTDQNGENITDAKDLSGKEFTTNILIDPPAPEDVSSMPLTANVFLAVYDEDGLMCSLDVWEIDLSDISHLLFMRTVHVPDNVRVSEIKTMILSDEMAPLISVSEL